MRSIVTVNTPATSIDLTTLETVKAEFGITGTDEDANLSRWITQASQAVASYCNRVFAQETVTETFRPDRTAWGWQSEYSNALYLSRKPVTSVTSLSVDSSAYTVSQYEIDYANGVIYAVTTNDPTYWAFASSIVVVYTAGYNLLGNLPHDIERAVISMVSSARSSFASGGDSDLVELEIEGVSRRRWARESSSTSSSSSSAALPADAAALLDPYVIRWSYMR